MGCEYPDAHSPGELWDTVLAGRRAFRRMPPQRLRLEDYWSADRGAPDRLYATEAALIEGWEFDRLAMRVPGPAYRAADVAHWLALDVALRALEDAGAAAGDGLPRDTTGVVLGNTLTGELTRASTMRLRWPYVARVLDASLREDGIERERRDALLRRVEAAYKAPFEPVGDETLAGALSNTIAGRICNHLDLHGGGYTIDGACSASLLAVATACERLASGELDVALAGGVDVSLDPFELVGFAKAGALAAAEMRVYDERSEGFWPGEGCGFVVLMRLADARAERRHVHAVVRGWGVSSDGAGGITRPDQGGQLLALRRAYARAGLEPSAVGCFEGHGTGTAVGDATELRALGEARRGAGEAAVVGSIKANIGHTKAAAGVAGFVKAALAVREGVLPPMPACERPSAALERAGLRVLAGPEPWDARDRVAGVSAMGFGGVNSHAVLAAPPCATPRARLEPRERVLAASAQDAELFLFAAPTVATLREQVELLAARAAGLSRAELGDAAAALASAAGGGLLRAAVVAGRPAELADRLRVLAEMLGDGVDLTIDVPPGVFIGRSDTSPRVALLFPGQGSPANLGGGVWRRRYPAAGELFAAAPQPGPGVDPTDTAVAQPAIVAASLAALCVLAELGVRADVAVGHSLGELSALAWAGVLDEPAALRIAALRGRAMADLPGESGSMVSVALDRAGAELLAAGLELSVAGMNAPGQTVLSGPAAAVAKLVARARRGGVGATPLRVSHAFHSPLVAPAAGALGAALETERFAALRGRVVSTVTGEDLDAGAGVRDLLLRQVTSPVQFERAARTACEGVELAIEAGPGRTLTGLVRGFLDVPVIALDAGGASLAGVLAAAGAAWAVGVPLRSGALFGDRFTRPFDLEREPRFIANPCESAPLPDGERAAVVADAEPLAPAPAGEAHVDDRVALVRELVAARAELPMAAVTAESRLLDDLHLSSIAVSEVAVQTARALGLPPPPAPNEFANATIAGLANALVEAADGAPAAAAGEPPGAAGWVRAFVVEERERERRSAPALDGGGAWRVLAPPGDQLADQLAAALPACAGTAVVLPPGPIDDSGLSLLLDGARPAGGGPAFLLVHRGSCATGFARSVHREHPNVRVCAVDAPRDEALVERAVAELAATNGFADVRYGADGRRREPVLSHMPLSAPAGAPPLGPDDVVLATGGAKGIATECVLALVRDTGAALGVVGRSDPALDAGVAANLERIRAAGVKVHYARADVTHAEGLATAVGEIEASLGRATAIVHAAGSNEPCPVAELDDPRARAAIAPKVDGLANLLAAVDAGAVRLLVTFGSIIARSGMRGDAHYALANELQTALTERFAAAHPDCACLAFESSVWAAVGMGERLGAVNALAREGVEAIAPEAGAALLARLVAERSRPVAVVVAGRFGRRPELALEQQELRLGRFLERTPVHYPGVELVAEADLSPDLDPYVDDHVLGGERLMPAVMTLEAMAQAADGARSGTAAPVFRDVRFESALVVAAGESTTVRVAALSGDAGEPGRVAVRSERTGFAVEHASAHWRPSDDAPGGVTAGDLPEPDADPVPLDASELYGTLLFQRGRFARLRRYLRLTATACVAEIDAGPAAGWFGGFLPQELVRGDPGARDAALHALQACIPHARVIPVGVDSIRPASAGGPGPWLVRARERSREGAELTWDLALVDAAGRVVERWDGLRLREVGPAGPAEPWPEPLLATYLERHLDGVRVALANGGGSRRERSRRAIRTAVGPGVAVGHRPDGRPETPARAVSTAHAGGLTLAVAGDGRVACDLEQVSERPNAVWRDLLGPERAAIQGQVEGDDATTATRIWAAGECLTKAGVHGAAPLTLAGRRRDGWLTLRSGALTVETYVARVRGFESPLAVAVLTGRPNGGDRADV